MCFVQGTISMHSMLRLAGGYRVVSEVLATANENGSPVTKICCSYMMIGYLLCRAFRHIPDTL